LTANKDKKSFNFGYRYVKGAPVCSKLVEVSKKLKKLEIEDRLLLKKRILREISVELKKLLKTGRFYLLWFRANFK